MTLQEMLDDLARAQTLAKERRIDGDLGGAARACRQAAALAAQLGPYAGAERGFWERQVDFWADMADEMEAEQ